MMVWQCRDFALPLDRARVMGILNVTPDSFSDGGKPAKPDAFVKRGLRLVQEGADVVDVGGESSRPGAEAVSARDELKRVLPVVRGLVKAGVVVSVDTRKAEVAHAALDEGARIVNDISAGEDPGMFDEVRRARAGMVLMRGGVRGWWSWKTDSKPKAFSSTFVRQSCYFFKQRLEAAMEAGVAREALVVDPGIGFTEDAEEDVALLRKIHEMAKLAPVLVGVSRKRFIGQITGEADPLQRLGGSLAAGLHAVADGARILRVHDVAATAQALKIWDKLDKKA